ncbi:MAG: glycosyltransferase [Candidatus Diapherotrites archaeon]
MPPNTKPAIIIPAYREAKLIGRAIDLVKQTGIDAKIIVVVDGRVDETAEIARSKRCEVVILPRNFGKANAIYAGMKAAARLEATAVVSLDADMVAVPKKDLSEMIEKAEQATISRKIKMFIGGVVERDPENPRKFIGLAHENSGIRAFSMPALHRVISSKFKKQFTHYAIEGFFSILFKEWEIVKLKTNFRAEKPHRHARSFEQYRQIDRAQARVIRNRRVDYRPDLTKRAAAKKR